MGLSSNLLFAGKTSPFYKPNEYSAFRSHQYLEKTLEFSGVSSLYSNAQSMIDKGYYDDWDDLVESGGVKHLEKSFRGAVNQYVGSAIHQAASDNFGDSIGRMSMGVGGLIFPKPAPVSMPKPADLINADGSFKEGVTAQDVQGLAVLLGLPDLYDLAQEKLDGLSGAPGSTAAPSALLPGTAYAPDDLDQPTAVEELYKMNPSAGSVVAIDPKDSEVEPLVNMQGPAWSVTTDKGETILYTQIGGQLQETKRGFLIAPPQGGSWTLSATPAAAAGPTFNIKDYEQEIKQLDAFTDKALSAASRLGAWLGIPSDTSDESIAKRKAWAVYTFGVIPLSAEQALAVKDQEGSVPYIYRPYKSSEDGLAGPATGWTMSGASFNDAVHPWADKDRVADLNTKYVSLAAFEEAKKNGVTTDYNSWRRQQIDAHAQEYKDAGAISIFDGQIERVVDKTVASGAEAVFYNKNFGIDTLTGIQTGYDPAKFAAMTDWTNPDADAFKSVWAPVFAEDDYKVVVSRYRDPATKAGLFSGTFAVSSPIDSYKQSINAKTQITEGIEDLFLVSKGQVSGSKITLDVGGEEADILVPFSAFHDAKGTISVTGALAGDGVEAEITGADLRLDNYGQALALLGSGQTIEVMPGMGASISSQGEEGIQRRFNSAAAYELGTTDNEALGLLHGSLEWVLLESGLTSNNFGVGAQAQFSDGVSKSAPIRMYGAQNAFWGEGLRFGENEAMPLDASGKMPTFWKTTKIDTGGLFGISGEMEFVDEGGGLTFSGTALSGWQFDKAETLEMQAAKLTTRFKGEELGGLVQLVKASGLQGEELIAPDKGEEFEALVQLSDHIQMAAGRGESFLFSSEIVKLAADGTPGAPTAQGAFATEQISPNVYLSTVANDSSSIAALLVDQITGPMQLAQGQDILAFDPMFKNAAHTFSGDIKEFVSGIQLDAAGEISGDIVAITRKDGAAMDGNTVVINSQGFAVNDGFKSGWRNINDVKLSYFVDAIADPAQVAEARTGVLSGVNFWVANGGEDWSRFDFGQMVKSVRGEQLVVAGAEGTLTAPDAFGISKPLVSIPGAEEYVLRQGADTPPGDPSRILPRERVGEILAIDEVRDKLPADYDPSVDEIDNFSVLQNAYMDAVTPSAYHRVARGRDGVMWASGTQAVDFSVADLNSPSAALSGGKRANFDVSSLAADDRFKLSVTLGADQTPEYAKGIFRGKDGNLVNEISIDHAGRVTTGGAGVFAGSKEHQRGYTRVQGRRCDRRGLLL